MTDRSPSDRRPIYLKLGGIALGLLVVVGLGYALFGDALGSPDEARRVRHPAGFSMCYPAGWGASVFQRPSRNSDTIRAAPERSTGRQTILQATRFDEKPKLGPTAADYTFQGQPAVREVAGTRYDWIWQVTFQRGGAWYHVQITSPIALDPEGDPLVRFAESFRTETPSTAASSTPTPTPPASAPSTSPAR